MKTIKLLHGEDAQRIIEAQKARAEECQAAHDKYMQTVKDVANLPECDDGDFYASTEYADFGHVYVCMYEVEEIEMANNQPVSKQSN